jgi:uncharacterized protein (TIGR03435 family)
MIMSAGLRKRFTAGILFMAGECATSAQGAAAVPTVPMYDVVSVRQNLNPEPRWQMGFTADGVWGEDVTLFWAMKEAYLIPDERCLGAPSWIDEKRFDIQAKYDTEKYPNLTLEQRNVMLQQMLADRFKLVLHHELKDFPVYALEIAKGGVKFPETKPENMHINSTYGPMCHILNSGKGVLEMQGCAIGDLVRHLSSRSQRDYGRPILDRTGLKGRYDIKLHWTPETPPGSPPPETEGPWLLTAVQEQLGLQLKATVGPLDMIVIDHAEMPSEN